LIAAWRRVVSKPTAMTTTGRNHKKRYRSKIGKTHLFQQKKYSGIVIIYFQCGLFVKVVETLKVTFAELL